MESDYTLVRLALANEASRLRLAAKSRKNSGAHNAAWRRDQRANADRCSALARLTADSLAVMVAPVLSDRF